MRYSLFFYAFSALILTVLGILFIYSSSSFLATNAFGNGYHFALKQFFAALSALVIAALISVIPTHFIYKLTPLFFFFCLILCIIPLLPIIGGSINGARRWIRILGITFQPAELLKPASILYFARYLSKQQYTINTMYPLFLCIIGITSFILLLQPDFGQAIVISLTGLIMLFIVECRLKYLSYIFTAALGTIGLLIAFKPYRLKRFLIFLNPWDDPQGAGFQIIQSLIGIANGGWSGLGIAHSKQKFFYLPMQHTDFIFSIICEETGIIGAFFVFSLYIVLLISGINLALKQKDLFSSLSITGMTFLITIQAIINIAVATGTVPTKGIGLPFISYGNSSLIGMFIIVAIVINMSLTSINFKSHNANLQ